MSPSRERSSVSSTVIIFVRLAIGTRSPGLWARSTSPVRPSSTTYARAWTLGPAARAGGTRERAAAQTSSLSFTGRKATRGRSERAAHDEHGRGDEQEERDRERVALRFCPPIHAYHPEADQTSLFSRAASAATAARQSSSVDRNAYSTEREAATSALAGPLVNACRRISLPGRPAPNPRRPRSRTAARSSRSRHGSAPLCLGT